MGLISFAALYRYEPELIREIKNIKTIIEKVKMLIIEL